MLFRPNFILFLALLSFGAGAPVSCPNKRDIEPCECRRVAYGLIVMCADFNNSYALIRALKVLRDYQVQTVNLHDLKLMDVLPEDLFDGLKINELFVEKSKLKFSQPAFTGLDDTLHILNVGQHSMIKSTENFSIARLNKLTQLNIKKNPLSVVRNQWLNGKLPNVESIRLEDDDIREIENRAFADLIHLQFISMADNRIQRIERSMFPRPAKELKTIDLSGNEITTLPYDFFYDMPKLTKVILAGNDITTLPETTWKSVWERLDTLSLYENNLICDNRLNWMKNLNWPKNGVVALCVAPTKMSGKHLEDVYKT